MKYFIAMNFIYNITSSLYMLGFIFFYKVLFYDFFFLRASFFGNKIQSAYLVFNWEKQIKGKREN